MHSGAIGLSGSSSSLVDYNRAGVPLLEIVTEPELRSGAEAAAAAAELRRILRYIGVTDGNMSVRLGESGRCERNVAAAGSGEWSERGPLGLSAAPQHSLARSPLGECAFTRGRFVRRCGIAPKACLSLPLPLPLICSLAALQEGGLRMDVNVSVRRAGDSGFGTKVEIKNMNSFSAMQRAIDYEIKRQVRCRRDQGR